MSKCFVSYKKNAKTYEHLILILFSSHVVLLTVSFKNVFNIHFIQNIIAVKNI